MFPRLAALLILVSASVWAEKPPGCANRPAPSSTLPTVADDSPEKKGLKQRLKDQFSQGCINAVGNKCWGSGDEKPAQDSPQPKEPQPPPEAKQTPGTDKPPERKPPAQAPQAPAPPPTTSSSGKKPVPDLSFPEEQSRQAEIQATGELPTHASATTSSSRATYDPPPSDDVIEMHPYDPHRAEKDLEVGDYYYKRLNWKAAISRYRESLYYRPRVPLATFKLADALEKDKQLDDAAIAYSEYVRQFPDGPQIAAARQALQRLAPRIQAQAARLRRVEIENDLQAGEAMIAQKNFPEAVNRFCELAANAPDNARGFFRLAQAQQEIGEFASAYANYQTYLKLAPDGPFAPEARREIQRLAPQVQQGQAISPSSGNRP